jgi:deoxycitidine kinase/deoxyguanosine kinase
MENIRIVSIEGNIGSGKSTILKHLIAKMSTIGDEYKIVFVDEPVSVWENIKDSQGRNMIEKFYENPQQYAFAFQIMAFTTRLIYLKNAIDSSLNAFPNKTIIIITERSLHTDCFVFAELLKKQNNIEDVCFQIYKQMFDEFSSNYLVDKLIYLQTTPEICKDRVKMRLRPGEECISLNYLTQCHEEHEIYIYEKMKSSHKLIIDGKLDIRENPQLLDERLELIKDHILQT